MGAVAEKAEVVAVMVANVIKLDNYLLLRRYFQFEIIIRTKNNQPIMSPMHYVMRCIGKYTLA
jgi:hypothetical protein